MIQLMETQNRKILFNECYGGKIIFYTTPVDKNPSSTPKPTTSVAHKIFPIHNVSLPEWLVSTTLPTTTSITMERPDSDREAEIAKARDCLLDFLNIFELPTIGYWSTSSGPSSSTSTTTYSTTSTSSPITASELGLTLTEMTTDSIIETVIENSTEIATKYTIVKISEKTPENVTKIIIDNVTEKLTEDSIETSIDRPTIWSVNNSIPMTTVEMTQGEPVSVQREQEETALTDAPDFFSFFEDENCFTHFAHSTIFVLIIFTL